MSSKKLLSEIYSLYSEKKYSEAAKKVQQVLALEPDNIYAKRYSQILKHYLNDKSQVGKIQTVKGKKLKCPHCQSAISISALSSENQYSIKKNQYNNLSLKCPYCHTKFSLQKKSATSYLGIKIGDEIVYNGKKYRTTGSVEYSGTWQEGDYYGRLRYLEWILLGKDNSYLYFSEGYFDDDGERVYEFEISQKVIPEFSIKLNNIRKTIEIDGKEIYFSEINQVSAEKLYGENSKVFKVGEKIKLGEFFYKGKKYVIEREKAGRQSEAGIYKTKSLTKKEASDLFGKKYKFDFIGGNIFGKLEDIWVYAFLLIFFIFSFLNKSLILGVFTIVGLIILYIIFSSIFDKQKIRIIFLIFIIGPIFGFLFVPKIANYFIDKEQIIELKDIDLGEKYQVKFESPNLKKTKITGTKRYDYGGIKTSYKETSGIKFSVKNNEDKEIIKNLQEGKDLVEETEKIFSESIYKLK